MEIEIIDTINNTPNSKIIISNFDKVSDLKTIIYNKLNRTIDKDRINLFYYFDSKIIYLSSNTCTLDTYPGFTSNTIVYIKDSGFLLNKKISSLIENLGPIVIQSFIYFFDPSFTPSLLQKLAYFMSIIHFLIQILGGIYLTSTKALKVSLAQMAMKCVLNWVIFGLVCGITLYNNDYQSSGRRSFKYAFVIMFFVFEYFALFYKMILYKNNKEEVNQKNVIGLYKLIAFPHYFMEFCAWVSYAIVVNTLPILIFTFGMFILLCTTSVNKKKSYLSKGKIDEDIDNKYVFIPFVF